MSNYEWLEKRRKLTVDNLRPWPENPRLNPEESRIHISDYAEDMAAESKDDFFSLLKSIAEFGFVPADPVLVWKNEENNKYYVAEGNRRLIALKLLRDPNKAPKSIRASVRKIASSLDPESIAKIAVCVAPTFEDAEWYINQRNSTSSLQRRWSRIQQQRWVASLYEKYEGDIDKLLSITRLDNSALGEYIRILKVREFLYTDIVKAELSAEEFDKANSYKFPITILERFFASSSVREKWGVEFDGTEVKIISNTESFLTAYAKLIKRIVGSGESDEQKIDTRTITSHLDEILESLPTVNLEPQNAVVAETESSTPEIPEETQPDIGNNVVTPNPVLLMKNNPNRLRLVLPIYILNTDSTRLDGLFYEFKHLPSQKYPNSTAASLRVFLDLSILNFIQREGLGSDMQRHYSCGLREIPLKKRIEYVKTNQLSGNPQKVAVRLLDETNVYSLDVLNGFVHSQDTHYMSRSNLNSFWDFLFPLFEFLLDIREENV